MALQREEQTIGDQNNKIEAKRKKMGIWTTKTGDGASRERRQRPKCVTECLAKYYKERWDHASCRTVGVTLGPLQREVSFWGFFLAGEAIFSR